jgi:hypothetical protein
MLFFFSSNALTNQIHPFLIGLFFLKKKTKQTNKTNKQTNKQNKQTNKQTLGCSLAFPAALAWELFHSIHNGTQRGPTAKPCNGCRSIDRRLHSSIAAQSAPRPSLQKKKKKPATRANRLPTASTGRRTIGATDMVLQ